MSVCYVLYIVPGVGDSKGTAEDKTDMVPAHIE